MADVFARLGARLRELRKERKLTQEALATRAGITWHFVSSLERGVKGATLETFIAIADALGVTLSELFVGVDHPLPRNSQRVMAKLTGQPLDTQRRILRVIDEMLQIEIAR